MGKLKAQYKDWKLTSTFMGNKNWDALPIGFANYNNHRVRVESPTGGVCYFEFWSSIMNGEMRKEKDVLDAFAAFLNDCLDYDNCYTFETFCNEFGFDTDSRSAERAYKGCFNSFQKLNRIWQYDIDDLFEMVYDLEGRDKNLVTQ